MNNDRLPNESPLEHSIYRNCLMRLIDDVQLIILRTNSGGPELVSLKKDTKVTLIDDRQMLCATDKGCGNGPLVRIEVTKDSKTGEDITDIRLIGKLLVVPAKFLEIHPDVL